MANAEEEDVFDKWERQQWDALLADGHSVEEVELAKRRKHLKEQVSLYSVMERDLIKRVSAEATCTCEDDLNDPPCGENVEFHVDWTRCENDVVEYALALAAGQEGLQRRWMAIEALQRAYRRVPWREEISLALAGLLFRDDRKGEAAAIYQSVLKRANEVGVFGDGAANASFMMGWCAIHSGDHTTAYKTWVDGAIACPTDERLDTQRRKRECWDVALAHDEGASKDYVGDGGIPLHAEDCDVFSIPEGVEEPALTLFDPVQSRRAVFRTQEPVMSHEECRRVIKLACEHADSQGGWGTVRHSSVRTTDVAVEDIKELRPWLRELMRTRLRPMLAACFPRLADGTDAGEGGERIRIHDAFIVRYDAEQDMSLSLPAHRDTSSVSMVLALNGDNAGDQDDPHYTGGGTWFKALTSDGKGMVVNSSTGNAVGFIGPLRHAGHPITRGTRFILVLFMYHEGFDYGPAVGYTARQESEAVNSETGQGSFVVYREVVSQLQAATALQDDH